MNQNAFTLRIHFIRAMLCVALVAAMTPPPAFPGQDRLAAIALDTFKRFGLSPMPRVRLVKSGSGDLERGELARAVVYDSGREEVRVSQRLMSDPRLPGAFDHEAAHLLTWRIHGHDVEVHGPEFRAICRKYARDPKSCGTHL